MNIKSDGFLISPSTTPVITKNDNLTREKTSNPEALNRSLKATTELYREDPKFAEIQDGNTNRQVIDEKVFEARKKAVDPLGLVPAETRCGISTDKINKDGKTIEIGTFNTEWLGCDEMKPRTEEDYKKTADIIKKSGAEVLALEEVADEKALNRVLKYIPEFDYVMGKTGIIEDGKSQRVALLYNKEKVECDKKSVTEITEAQVPKIAGDGHLRAPLAARFKSKEGGFDFTLVGMHLKARMDDRSQNIRKAQAEVVNKWIKNKQANEPDKDIIVVGDCNDFLGSKAMQALGNGNILHMTTAESAVRGENSHHGKYQSLIDQIGITAGKGGAVEEYIPNTTYVVQGDSGADHNPVVSSFKDVDND